MKIRYDKETDSKYIELTSDKKKVSRTKKVKDWLLFDYDGEDKIMGIEILDVSQHPTAFVIENTGIEHFPIKNTFLERKHEKDHQQDYVGWEESNEIDLVLERETMAI